MSVTPSFRRRLALVAVIGTISIAVVLAATRLSTSGGARAALARFVAPPELALRPDASTRLLVIAPHPDDESLAAAGLIRRVITAGGSVHVVVVTSGDAFPEGVSLSTHKISPRSGDFRAYARTRENETTAAMLQLGVDRTQVRFLGFPDGGLCLIASTYLSARARAFESPYTGRRQPPPADQVIRDIEYRGADVRRELEAVVAAYEPTVVVMPAGEDDHPDHCATAIFAREALDIIDARRHSPRTDLQYLIHTGSSWPNQSDAPGSELRAPGLATPGQQWRTLRLNADEAALKQRVLVERYPSQTLVIGSFLKAFERPNELFLEGRPTAPPECWCDDTHVATELPPERYRRARKARR
jgi:LmbE family N-acetylglucosaminyl deacetylase